MRIKKVRALICFVLVIVFVTVVLNYSHTLFKKNVVKETNESLIESNIDIETEKLKNRIKNTDRLITNILSETEIILLEEVGSLVIKHDKNNANDFLNEWLFNSEIEFTINYSAVLSIPTEKIVISSVDSKTYAKYNINDIKVKCISINNIIPNTKKGMLGKPYTPIEISALTKIAIEKIKYQTQHDSILLVLASKNLENYITSIAIKFLIFDIEIEEITNLY